MKKRFIVLDLGNGGKSELFGKDIATTNADSKTLQELSSKVLYSTYLGIPAEEYFLKLVREEGFEIEIVGVLDELEMISASAKDY